MKTYCSKLVTDVHVLLIKEERILLLRRFKTGFEDGKYSVIAGHRNKKETVRQAAIREAEEEAGVRIAPQELQLIHVTQYSTQPHRVWFLFHSTRPQRIGLFFVAKNWQGEPENKEPHKSDDLTWFPLEHLPQNMISYVRLAIEMYQENIAYSEYDWNK